MKTEIRDGHVWCPLCKDHVQLFNIQQAAKLADHSTRSIRRYIEAGEIYNVRVAGHGRLLVCDSCLLQDSFEGEGRNFK